MSNKVSIYDLSNDELLALIENNIKKYARNHEACRGLLQAYAMLTYGNLFNDTKKSIFNLLIMCFGEMVKKPVRFD